MEAMTRADSIYLGKIDLYFTACLSLTSPRFSISSIVDICQPLDGMLSLHMTSTSSEGCDSAHESVPCALRMSPKAVTQVPRPLERFAPP